MKGFEIFDITSWLDVDGLVLKAVARAKTLPMKRATRALGRSLVAGMAISISGLSVASAPIQLELPFVVQAATPPRAEELLAPPSNDSSDAATSKYWAALMNHVSSWAPIDESAAISPEPLD